MKISFPEHHLFQLLRQFDHQHLPLDLFLSNYFRAHRALGSKDRQLIAQAVYGMARWKSLLDHLTTPYPNWEQRYALFRSFQPASYFSIPTIPLHIRLSIPQELLTLLIENYGEEKAIQLAQICNTEAPITVRVNPLKITRERLLEKWKSLYDVTPCCQAPYGIQFKKRAPLVAMPEFREGFFEIQDEASQIVATCVKAEPGQHILDYCAGSGGKTLAFAHQLENKGQIYLHDIRPSILEQARKRLRRAGIQNIQLLPPSHPGLLSLKGKMDLILLDVPCSGTGTYRRNPDQKWKFSRSLLTELIQQQRKIFEQALIYLKPGGSIIYATCSILKAENESQVNYFIEKFHFTVKDHPFISVPTYGGMDGFYAAHLIKK